MKKIAITQRLILNNTYYEMRECLHMQWGALFKLLGWTPVILPHETDINEMYENIGFDGVILSGGNDLYEIKGTEENRIRDEYEKNVIKFCIEKEIPVFGVCRGLQIINSYFGGSLASVEDHSGTVHDVVVNANSSMFEHLSNFEYVNSYHNYAVEKLGSGLFTSVLSTDGCIEAVEHKELKIFAVMWHPERGGLEDCNFALLKGFFG